MSHSVRLGFPHLHHTKWLCTLRGDGGGKEKGFKRRHSFPSSTAHSTTLLFLFSPLSFRMFLFHRTSYRWVRGPPHKPCCGQQGPRQLAISLPDARASPALVLALSLWRLSTQQNSELPPQQIPISKEITSYCCFLFRRGVATIYKIYYHIPGTAIYFPYEEFYGSPRSHPRIRHTVTELLDGKLAGFLTPRVVDLRRGVLPWRSGIKTNEL